jgi:nucleotide-binding universal stress UspA family protein
MVRSILVAVDGSPAAARAVALAAGIAERDGSRLTAITVYPRSTYWGFAGTGVAPLLAAEAAEAERVLEEASDQLPVGMELARRRVWGTPADAICREAEAGGHDLVVMGSRGRSAVTAALLGSTARSVVATAEFPVIVTRANSTGGDRISRILVAVDGSAESWIAFEEALDLCHGCGARLTVITVAAGIRRAPGMPESAAVRLRADAAEHARELLHEALAAVPVGVAVELRCVWGQVVPSLLEEVERGGHDLLVLGSRGRGMVRSAVLGSTGYPMLSRCPVPVLVARSRPRLARGGGPAPAAGGRAGSPSGHGQAEGP